nr:testis-specific serine/threonine-protein kinase 3-like [Pocillopora verrucosa]
MFGFAFLSVLIGFSVLPFIYVITKLIPLLEAFGDCFRSKEEVSSQNNLDENAFLRGYGYELDQVIGQGSYADVRKAYSIKSEREVAIKIVHKEEDDDGKKSRFLKREIEILKWLNHKNVIRVFDVIDGENKFFIVMEMAPKGDLLSLLLKRYKLTENEAKAMFKSIVDGVLYCHKKGVTHRDLKLENILLSEENEPIVTDFGFARYIGAASDQRTRSRTFCGSYAYVAPEILQGIPYDGMASDVWSLGVVLYTLLCGSFPFDDSNPKTLLQETTSGELEYPTHASDLSDQTKDLIKKMLSANVRERITLAEVMDHPWLQEDATAS